MSKKNEPSSRSLLETKTGCIRKNQTGRIRIALVYPNTYHIGMSSLGFQAVYQLFNTIEDVICHRAFLPEKGAPGKKKIETVEARKPLAEYDIIAFSISFEHDYPNILSILERSGLPLQSRKREFPLPLVIAGGVACFLNPEPIAPFIDCFLIGEAETMIDRFSTCLMENSFDPNARKEPLLESLALNVSGAYVPDFYEPGYHANGSISSFNPLKNFPGKIKRTCVEDLSNLSTCSAVITPNTTFDNTFLVEVSRGCPHGCRFCGAGFIYRPPRFRPVPLLEQCMVKGAGFTDKIGLVGAAVSDLPGIKELCDRALNQGARLSFSSLRAEAIDTGFAKTLNQSRVKTATIAPDAGSERLRKVINKGISEEDVMKAVETLVINNIINLKIYFMIGLPTETMDDIQEIISLCKKIKHVFLITSRRKKRIGAITVSLNSFVPKPFTPFQWAPMDSATVLKKKIKTVKQGLKTIANIRVKTDVPRRAYIQAFLSRGDRKVSEILMRAHKNKGNWAQTLKASPINTDFYVLREREKNEIFPWDFIDHGLKKSFLYNEYIRALETKTSPPCPIKSCNICGVCK